MRLLYVQRSAPGVALNSISSLMRNIIVQTRERAAEEVSYAIDHFHRQNSHLWIWGLKGEGCVPPLFDH